ncbi:MAG: hypothetical protein WC536_04755 [Patescibacteria group bacterium]
MPDPTQFDPNILPESDQANFLKSDEQRKKEQESGELELTPELVEQIMEKVVDVDASGLAVHAFESTVNSEQVDEALEKTEAILTEGLLGSEESPDPVPSDPQKRKERWYKNTRSRDPRRSNIHFLILGKGSIKSEWTGKSYPIKLSDRYSGSNSTLSILFDISS